MDNSAGEEQAEAVERTLSVREAGPFGGPAQFYGE